MNIKAPAAAAGFIGCILAANYVTTEYGMVPVGFGLVATAGTYFAGATFVLRDALQDSIRASLRPRVAFVEDVYELTIPGGQKRRISQGFRREERPPSEWRVALPVIAVILFGAALSFLISAPLIALASAVAFLMSETADFLIYQPLRDRGYLRAAVASNIVGAIVDTVAFLTIAGFPIRQAIAGQLVGKIAVTLAVVAAVAAVRTRRTVTA